MINDLKRFLLLWSLSKLSQNPATKIEDITAALRAAADELEGDSEIIVNVSALR
jgi:hypothetical protein